MPRPILDLTLLIVVSFTVMFTNLGGPPLWDRDEPRNAGCAAEMTAAGDWVVPVFNGELRTHKPILLYWCTMTAYAVFGQSEFAARFTSASLGVLTVLLTYGIAYQLFHRRIALWSGLILTTCLLFNVASRAATPDALLICCGTASVYAFVIGTFRHDVSVAPFPSQYRAVIAMYVAMGLGVLAKGPVGLVLPTGVIGMYLLIMRLSPTDTEVGRWKRLHQIARVFAPAHFLKTCWSMRPQSALCIVGIVALPWYVWVHLRTNGAWTHGFFWTHNVSRAATPMEGHTGPPILFYVIAILVGCFPWSILTVSTAKHVWRHLTSSSRDHASRAAVTLLLCWIGVYVGLFSMAQTKLPSYVTPCYPAVAILIGWFIQHWSTSTDFSKAWVKIGFANLLAVGLLLLVGMAWAAHEFLPGSEWVSLVGIFPLVGGAVGWCCVARDHHRWAARGLAVTAILFALFLHSLVAWEVGRHQQYATMLSQTRTHRGPILALGMLEPSWIYYGGRPIREFAVQSGQDFVDFVSSHPHALIITTKGKLEATLSGRALEAFRVVGVTDYFLRDRKLLLIRPERGVSAQLATRPPSRSRQNQPSPY